MRDFSRTSLLAAALGATMLTGCSQVRRADRTANRSAAVLSVFADISGSAPMSNKAFADAVVQKVGSDFARFQLGDGARIALVGDASADRAETQQITTSYRLRVPAAQQKLMDNLQALFANYRTKGGDGSTNLLYTLEHSHPVCTPGSQIDILSDGLESSANYSVGEELYAGKPVNLPPPPSRYLNGCSVVIYGLGLSATGPGGSMSSALPEKSMRELERGWLAYLRAAGAGDVRFQSII